MALFEIKNLKFSYPTAHEGSIALDDVSFTIEAGEYVTVCGRSGSGKTTLLRNLKGTMAPAGKISGEILFDGVPVKDVPLREQASLVGYVMQDPESQIVTDKVWHELAFGLESLGCDQKTMRLKVAEMASYFGIEKWFNRNVNELSGGQKQLLNLASVMAMQPKVIILDEPTSQLDPIAAADFLATIRRINQELGITIIITEHRLEDIYPSSDKIIVLEKGKIEAIGTPGEVGKALKEKDSPMFFALPAPMRIFYQVNDVHSSEERCPLNVREGRQWLSRLFEGKQPEYVCIDQDKTEEASFEYALSAKEIRFRYEKDGDDVLKGLNLQVKKGSIYAILGGNGSGKTTLLRCICGSLLPYSGKLKVEGESVSKKKRPNAVLLPQDPRCLFVKKTVREDLEEMTGNSEKIQEIAKTCEIEGILETHPFDISGGELQRAALAKVLMTGADIILIDEPTKGMDSFFKIKFAQILEKLKEQGKTIVMVSHDIEFCAKHVDEIGMLFDGQIISSAPPQLFFSENSFYTTAANRMSRHIFKNAITVEAVTELCIKNLS